MSTLYQIVRLYERQGLLYDKAGRGEWLTPAELSTFAAIRADLAKLWPARRQELAGPPEELPGIVKTESQFYEAPRLIERAVGE